MYDWIQLWLSMLLPQVGEEKRRGFYIGVVDGLLLLLCEIYRRYFEHNCNGNFLYVLSLDLTYFCWGFPVGFAETFPEGLSRMVLSETLFLNDFIWSISLDGWRWFYPKGSGASWGSNTLPVGLCLYFILGWFIRRIELILGWVLPLGGLSETFL